MIDILAIAAHPDDVELNVAGTLLKEMERGRSVAICDVTAGERGTRGSAGLRAAETAAANRAMGLPDSHRRNLGITDGDIRVTRENILRVVTAIRYFRPKVLLLPWHDDRHPDHIQVNSLVRTACFDAGLRNVETEADGLPQTPHRPDRMYTFFQAYETVPDFIVDVSDQFERKLDAIAAYSSQFTVPGRAPAGESGEPATFISGSDFMEFIVARMRHWGFMIGARYGEAFGRVGMPLKINDLLDTL